MKKLIVIVVILTTILTASLFAGETNNTPMLSYKLTSQLYNKYLAFGSGGMLHNDTVLQSDILVSVNTGTIKGTYVDIWHSYGLDGKFSNSDLGDEVDFNVGYFRPLQNGCYIDLGINYFNEPNLGTLGAGDIWLFYAEIGKEVKTANITITPYYKFSAYIPNPGSGFQGNKLIAMGFKTAPKWNRFAFPINTGVTYDTGGFGLKDGVLFKVFAGVDTTLGKGFTLNFPYASLYIPTMSDARETDIVFGGGITYRF